MNDRYFAPAKVNLGLSVLGLRPDGYHEVQSVMVPLSLVDTLSIEAAETFTLRVEGADLPTDERNLVYRAARAYLDVVGIDAGMEIVLRKNLPLAAGLGGGSSDAATTLMALAELYPADVDLPALALQLGADVPFFLLRGPALAQGIGERLTPLRVPETALVLVNPGVEVSARDAYRWLDEAGGFTAPLDVPAILEALQLEALHLEALRPGADVPYLNALQPGVAARYPEIVRVLQALADVGLRSPLMSGSGSTCFGLAPTDGEAQAAAERLAQAYPGWWVAACHTVQGPVDLMPNRVFPEPPGGKTPGT